MAAAGLISPVTETMSKSQILSSHFAVHIISAYHPACHKMTAMFPGFTQGHGNVWENKRNILFNVLFCLISEEVSFLNPLSPSTSPFHLFATTVFQGHIQTNDLCEKWIHQAWPWTQLLFTSGAEMERMKGFCAGAQSVRHMCSRK